jgi:hypothetical protein
MRSRVVAVIVAVVVPLAALGVVIAQRGGSTHGPARLPIAFGGLGGEQATPAIGRADSAVYPYGVIVYKAAPGLAALNGSAHAYKVTGGGDAAAARRLADAFGLDGIEPDAASTFTNGDAQLSVAPTGFWGYTRQSSGGAVSSSGSATACPPDAADCAIPPTTVPEHPADLPSQDDAKAAALTLLERAGIDTAHATVSVDDFVTQWAIRVDPVVDGTPTEGFGTTVSIGEGGAVDYANGFLGTPEQADVYPLIGTTAAIDRMNKGEGFVGIRPLQAAGTPMPMVSSAPPEATTTIPAGGSSPGSVGGTEPAPLLPCDGTGAPTTFPCGSPLSQPPLTGTVPPPPPQEIAITDAAQILLLAPSIDGATTWLVPAYRFSTADGVGPTVLAIDDSFLTPPDQVPDGKGGGINPDSSPEGTVTFDPTPAPASDGGR